MNLFSFILIFLMENFLMQDWNEFTLYIDADNNDQTGSYVSIVEPN